MDNVMKKVGCLHMRIWDNRENMGFPVFVMYPAKQAFGDLKLGPYTIQAGLNAFVADGKFPFVVISHGSGGNRLAYLGIAQILAEAGYVVAMPEHFGNHKDDNFLQGSTRNLQLRPRHVGLCIDEVGQNGILNGTVLLDQVAVIGHSMGGYTGLAMAGGRVWNNLKKPVPVIPDKRVRALVLMAPATDWFRPDGSLAPVKIPVLAYLAQHDVFTAADDINIVLDQIEEQSKLHRHIVENANHFSFLSPFPDEMNTPEFTPALDRDGFDRVDFHQKLTQEILGFLKQALK